MECKYCGAELVEGKPFCPSCGKNQEETPCVESAEPAKAGSGKIALAVAAVVVVLAVLAALVVGGMDGSIFGGAEETVPPTETAAPTETVPAPTVPADGNPDDVTCKGTYTVTDDQAYVSTDTVVATMGDKELTNGLLQIYYWEEVYAFLQEYSGYVSYFGLDVTQGLDTQMYSTGEDAMTWQQYFLKCALNTWMSHQSIALEGQENDYVMNADEQAYVDGLEAELTSLSEENGYENVEAFIKYLVGAGPSVEDYVRYVETYKQGYSYFCYVYDSIQPTAEEIETFFAENEASYLESGITKDSGFYVDIRHILTIPEGGETGEDGYPVYTEEAWAEALTRSDEIYNEWKKSDKAEDTFGQLAQKYSEDGSASNGGLYTGVAQGDMVENFDSWCFEEGRKVGDFDRIQTQFGYHIMYYSASTEIWFATAKSDLINKTASDLIPDAMEKHPAQINYSAIELGFLALS